MKSSIIISILIFINSIYLSAQTFSGTVRDAETQKPIPNATVTTIEGINNLDVYTDKNGFFRLSLKSDVKIGSAFTLRISKKGYLIYEENRDVIINRSFDFEMQKERKRVSQPRENPEMSHVIISNFFDTLFIFKGRFSCNLKVYQDSITLIADTIELFLSNSTKFDVKDVLVQYLRVGIAQPLPAMPFSNPGWDFVSKSNKFSIGRLMTKNDHWFFYDVKFTIPKKKETNLLNSWLVFTVNTTVEGNEAYTPIHSSHDIF